MNGKRVRAGAVTVDEIETYTEDAEVTTAAAVNEMSLTLSWPKNSIHS